MAHARIELNTKDDIKQTIEKAAALSGMAVSAFIISNCLPKARKIVENEKRVSLDSKAAQAFLSLLDNPPKPNQKLKDLLKS
ncbi:MULTISPECIES: DUF1778 domain-containing protein [Cysteiniphilum]|uniref:type II toxin-antitoxin system TacA family antitoxin n=1 Tax=Cysteiniphilum TaxID=2056696 RepID=UPI0017831E5F|nr:MULTISPECIES: DUF1778 domain-containing protein [Cysteiniphilum]